MNAVEETQAESDNESSSSTISNENLPRTRNGVSRLAKKSTGGVQEAQVGKAVTRRQIAIANREKNRFLENFNPETSEREKRKLNKKMQATKKGILNDNKGIHINTGVDLCDCLEIQCVGCFYPCKKCNSSKCGIECRVYRKTKYESIEYHGYNFIKTNPLEAPEK